MTQRILVLGGGFAGLWAAASAARVLDQQRVSADRVDIALVNRDGWHSIRVRNYESDLAGVRVPLHDVLDPIGVRLIEAEVTSIDPERRQVCVGDPDGDLAYDRLIFALGSRMQRPRIPGAERAFDVDTYGGASRLAEHLERGAGVAAGTVVVVGAGLTGVEMATELTTRRPRPRIILIDRSPAIGSDMGADAVPVIEQALRDLDVETRTSVSVSAIDPAGAILSDGTVITGATVVWCTGMRAHPLAAAFGVTADDQGRIPVTSTLKMVGRQAEFAAGDAARLMVDAAHPSVMSCQHARPMGRFAGNNAVSDLLGLPLSPLSIPDYVTCLDLGPWGALYTRGWDRRVVTKGEAAKQIKTTINRQRIYPPRNDRSAILAAAAPVVQALPVVPSDRKA